MRSDSWTGSDYTSSPWHLSTVEPVDVLEALGVHRGQTGVTEAPGFCPQRSPQGDRAFRVGKSSLLSVPTWQLFPGESGQEGWGGGHPGWVTSPRLSNGPLTLCPRRWAFSSELFCAVHCAGPASQRVCPSVYLRREGRPAAGAGTGASSGSLWRLLQAPPQAAQPHGWQVSRGRGKGPLWKSLH